MGSSPVIAAGVYRDRKQPGLYHVVYAGPSISIQRVARGFWQLRTLGSGRTGAGCSSSADPRGAEPTEGIVTITHLQGVLPERPDAVGSDSKIVMVHYDAQDHPVYWAGWTNGHDGQGWTADRSEALEFTTFSAANIERNRARRWHPGMSIKLDGGGE